MSNLGIPEVIMLCFIAGNLLINFQKHGKPREPEHNIYISVIAEAITLSLLISGGFFN